MDAKLRSKPYDNESYNKRVCSAVTEVVRKQVECGVDIVTDGEQGKASFNAYVVER
jgi:5-methyltetrahydropteroyltriglutamate--homocysteine methyltransferase